MEAEVDSEKALSPTTDAMFIEDTTGHAKPSYADPAPPKSRYHRALLWTIIIIGFIAADIVKSIAEVLVLEYGKIVAFAVDFIDEMLVRALSCCNK